MNKFVIIFLFISEVLLSCKERSQSKELSETTSHVSVMAGKDTFFIEPMMTLDVTQDYPRKEFVIQDIADIEYIPLESRSDVLLVGGWLEPVFLSDSLLITYSGRENAVYIFNRAGKILRTFNRCGRGNGEYQNLGKLTVDFDAQEIFIYDYALKYRILVYSFEGDYKRTLRIPGRWLGALQNYDSEFLLGYDDQYCNDMDMTKANKQPYFFISKKDGQVMVIDLNFETRMNTLIFYSRWAENDYTTKSISQGIPSCSMIKNGTEVTIADWSCDTVYLLENRKLIPLLVKIPSGKDCSPQILNRAFLRTKRYTFISSVKKLMAKSAQDSGQQLSYTSFVCDHYTHSVYKSYFVNQDYLSDYNFALHTMLSEIPENYAVHWFTVSGLLEKYRSGKLRGELKTIASRLQEDDNPVLMLVKFKE